MLYRFLLMLLVFVSCNLVAGSVARTLDLAHFVYKKREVISPKLGSEKRITTDKVARALELMNLVYKKHEIVLSRVRSEEKISTDKISRSLDLAGAIFKQKNIKDSIKKGENAIDQDLLLRCKSILQYYKQRQIFVKTTLNAFLSELPSFDPIEQEVLHVFNTKTLPQIKQQFTTLNAQRSSAYKQALKQAEDNLNTELDALRYQFRRQIIKQGMDLLEVIRLKYPDLFDGPINQNNVYSLIQALVRVADDLQNNIGRDAVIHYLEKEQTSQSLQLLKNLKESQFIIA